MTVDRDKSLIDPDEYARDVQNGIDALNRLLRKANRAGVQVDVSMVMKDAEVLSLRQVKVCRLSVRCYLEI